MGQFTKLVKREFEFQDEKVTVTFERLKRKDVMRIFPVLKDVGASFADLKDEEEMSSEDAAKALEVAEKFLDILGERLEQYIHRIEGLTGADNEEIDKHVVCEEAYFIPLVTELVMAMLEESLGPSKKKGS